MIERLPKFPWDVLFPYRKLAAAHPDGLVNLALGDPVDRTPAVVRAALAAAADAPGYPSTEGTPQLREAVAAWLLRREGVSVDPSAVIPAVGTKELIAWLPTMLGLGPSDVVLVPELAFPTYEVSARLAGARLVRTASPLAYDGPAPRVVWLNSPSNPEGRVLGTAELRAIVGWARERGALVVNDECYLDHVWEGETRSVLHPEISGGSHEGVLAVHSLSKRSNLAGYRAGFAAGDPAVIATLLEVRKHAGHMVPAPVQAAMVAALGDDSHLAGQRGSYARRRAVLRAALLECGFRIDHSVGALFLWATRDEPCWVTVGALAELGILVAPGEFYGEAGARHVRVAVTETDERVEQAVKRLAAAF
ncbi:succinyldiaminopimelate transaminase [Kitasatospora sp. NPDC058243]|uniref:succinyldiaminopimelate transaminase n=1 Tax=Kitasatospora sp. NPDC058243 TaxID=3346397 RepID=UPI0036D8B664